MFAPARRSWDGKEKDTLINIRDTKEFSINIVSEDIGEKMVKCSTDYEEEIDEYSESGLSPLPSKKIKPPIVSESKINLECVLNQIVQIGKDDAGSGFIVIGTIVLFHIDDEVYDNGRIILDKLQPLGRVAGNGYIRSTNAFDIIRTIKPDD
tara:strand:- start:593 stop:1048 length:456 start_codon:yes stop_codon:yes gene_type:complete